MYHAVDRYECYENNSQIYSCREISLITKSENLMKTLRELKIEGNPMRIEAML